MKQISKILNVLSWPVYVCIVIYLLIAAPMVAGYHPVIVLSGSMEPTYHVSSIIYYKSAPFGQIQVGDAITYRAGGDSMVTHRVTQKMEISQEFVTKGDANPTEDPSPVSYDHVVGKVHPLSIPYAGHFVNFGKKPAVIAVMAFILVAGIVTDQLAEKGTKHDTDDTSEKRKKRINGQQTEQHENPESV